MGRNSSAAQTVVEQNGRKHFLQKISITTSAGVTTIGATTVDGLTVDQGATLCLQATQDFWYQLLAAGASTSVTDTTGARPGVKIIAGQQEYIVTKAGDAVIDLKADSASGVVVVHLVD